MKTITLFILLLFISVPSAYSDTEKKVSRKISESYDEEPCTCVFNKNRMWNPESIVWNNEEWRCSEYNEDGTCGAVARITLSRQDPCKSHSVPMYCVFNLDNAPKTIEFGDTTWTCTKRNAANKCTQAEQSAR
jgi:hypothetical protein